MIRVKGLTKKFGNTTVLNDLNMDVRKGEIITIIGPSGTGKSTLLRCLNLLERPTSGEIYIENINILDTKINVSKLRQKMGMVFQSFNLFPHIMVIENIMLAPVSLLKISPKQAYEEAMKLLGIVGLTEKAFAYPFELSGGQKQRVAIARALAMKPEIMLFDEPTSALDPTMTNEVLGVIKRLANDGMAMIIVTHEMKFAFDVSTRVLFMDEGIIYEDSSPQEIFNSPKKDKTRIFVHQINIFTYTIKSPAFDLYHLIAEIEEFGKKHFLTKTQNNNIQLVLEELVMQKILPFQTEIVDINIKVDYAGKNGVIEITLDYLGESYNPLEYEDLPSSIVKGLSSEIKHSYRSDRNILKITLKA